MGRGKHSKGSIGRGWIVAVLALAGVVLLGGGTAYAAYRYDRAAASRILPGVRIDGVDVGGLTREEAVLTVTRDADLELNGTLEVTAAGFAWQVTPVGLGTHADVAGAVDAAFRVGDSMSFFSRVYHRLSDEPIQAQIPLGYAYDDEAIGAFVQQAYGEVTEPAVNAAIRLVNGNLVVRHARAGEALQTRAAVERIRSALERQLSAVRVPVKVVEPAVTAATLGGTLVVDLSENELYLYDGLKVARQYPVATAAPGYSTPVGAWRIIEKRENPSWSNPAPDGWGADLPLYIPPGPGNPLGTRALYLSAPGIRIHGTYNSASIGTYASHGCIRMLISDSEALFPLVPVGTKVIIKP